MPSGMQVEDTDVTFNPADRPKQAFENDFVEGKHYWVAAAAYRVSTEQALLASQPGNQVMLDMENLLDLQVGCFKCEKPFSSDEAYSYCEGKPSLESYLGMDFV